MIAPRDPLDADRLRERVSAYLLLGAERIAASLDDLRTAQDRLAQGLGAPCIALGTAAWLRFLQERSDDGSVLIVDDPSLTAAFEAEYQRIRAEALGATIPAR